MGCSNILLACALSATCASDLLSLQDAPWLPLTLPCILQSCRVMQPGKALSRRQTASFTQPLSAVSAAMSNHANSSVVKEGNVKRVSSAKMDSRTQSRLKGNQNCKPHGGELPCCLSSWYGPHTPSSGQTRVGSLLLDSLVGNQQICRSSASSCIGLASKQGHQIKVTHSNKYPSLLLVSCICRTSAAVLACAEIPSMASTASTASAVKTQTQHACMYDGHSQEVGIGK